jgi:hypothetical protein
VFNVYEYVCCDFYCDYDFYYDVFYYDVFYYDVFCYGVFP